MADKKSGMQATPAMTPVSAATARTPVPKQRTNKRPNLTAQDREEYEHFKKFRGAGFRRTKSTMTRRSIRRGG